MGKGMYHSKNIGFYNGTIKEKDIYEIGNICILLEYQRKGIGSQILNYILKENDTKDIYLQYFKNNPVGNLYKKLRFVFEKEELTTYFTNDKNKIHASIVLVNNHDYYLIFSKLIKGKTGILGQVKTPKIHIEKIDDILEIMDFLSFKKTRILEYNEIVYQKSNIKIYLDLYKTLGKSSNVAIIGEINEANLVYQEIRKLKNNNEEWR